MCRCLLVQFFCIRNENHPYVPINYNRKRLSEEERNLLKERMTLREEGLVPCGLDCAVDEYTLPALPVDSICCYEGLCTYCLEETIRLKTSDDPDVDREWYVGQVLGVEYARQKGNLDIYIRFPQVRTTPRPHQACIAVLTKRKGTYIHPTLPIFSKEGVICRLAMRREGLHDVYEITNKKTVIDYGRDLTFPY